MQTVGRLLASFNCFNKQNVLDDTVVIEHGRNGNAPINPEGFAALATVFLSHKVADAQWDFLQRLSLRDLQAMRLVDKTGAALCGHYLLSAAYDEKGLLQRVVVPDGLAGYLKDANLQKRRWAWKQIHEFQMAHKHQKDPYYARPGNYFAASKVSDALMHITGVGRRSHFSRVEVHRHDDIPVSRQCHDLLEDGWMFGRVAQFPAFVALAVEVRQARPHASPAEVVDIAAALVAGRGYRGDGMAKFCPQVSEPIVWALLQTEMEGKLAAEYLVDRSSQFGCNNGFKLSLFEIKDLYRSVAEGILSLRRTTVSDLLEAKGITDPAETSAYRFLLGP